MQSRKQEENRLKILSNVSQYSIYADNIDSYISLLRELDEICNDGTQDSVFQNI